MRISTQLRSLTARDIRAKLTQDIGATVQLFALVSVFITVLCTALLPRIIMDSCLLGIGIVSAFVLIANNLRHEAGTALWCCAMMSGFIAGDVVGLIPEFLAVLFLFAFLWLMWYITPLSQVERE
jgi:Zn-dependent protease with chaperone function